MHGLQQSGNVAALYAAANARASGMRGKKRAAKGAGRGKAR